MAYEPVIGLEIHAVLETQSKMFCDCPVVDSTHPEPNDAVCPVCAGMPGMLPVLNKAAVEYGLRVALALNCEIQPTSIFARKSYFYPDLPKGFQISQYEQPLAVNGWLDFESGGEVQRVRIRRVHLEEDTGKLTHSSNGGERHSLVDLNRSGIPLLEIVTEPELHSAEAVRDFAYALRSIMRYLGVNSGNLEKGLLRIEPNISVRPEGSQEFATRVEIKNLNSFRAVERAVLFELERQAAVYEEGGQVEQQTLGWDDIRGATIPQRSKEVAEDYRYFPEPDLPPLMLKAEWIEEIRAALPELPLSKRERFMRDFELSGYDAGLLTAERDVADFFEASIKAAKHSDAKTVANWISGPLFSRLKDTDTNIAQMALSPEAFAALLDLHAQGELNASGTRQVLAAMLESGKDPVALMKDLGLEQVSDAEALRKAVDDALAQHPENVEAYLAGKEELFNWFFGQIMAAFKGKANPKTLRKALESALIAKQEE